MKRKMRDEDEDYKPEIEENTESTESDIIDDDEYNISSTEDHEWEDTEDLTSIVLYKDNQQLWNDKIELMEICNDKDNEIIELKKADGIFTITIKSLTCITMIYMYLMLLLGNNYINSKYNIYNVCNKL